MSAPDHVLVLVPNVPGRSTLDRTARAQWLPRLGPTAWLILGELEEETIGRRPGEHVCLDLVAVGRRLGVKPSIVVRSLERLARFRVVHFDAQSATLLSDGTVPR